MLTSQTELITCDVCAEDKTLSDFIHRDKHGHLNIPVPPNCVDHICVPLAKQYEYGEEDETLNLICTECITTHIKAQLQRYGAEYISCIRRHPTRLVWSRDWSGFIYGFLPSEMHSHYTEQRFESCKDRNGMWECPNNCGFKSVAADPYETDGYPQVECPTCTGRFCAGCKVPWHTHMSCQQYRARYPEARELGEDDLLREMAALGARRCLRRNHIIVKDGGCDHMSCNRCRHQFAWYMSEEVQTPPPVQEKGPGNSTTSEVAKNKDSIPTSHFGTLTLQDRVYEDASWVYRDDREDCEADLIAAQGFNDIFKNHLPYYGIEYDEYEADFTYRSLYHDWRYEDSEIDLMDTIRMIKKTESTSVSSALMRCWECIWWCR